LLAYAHNWAKNSDGTANPDKATALLALYGWGIWQIMEVFFCALSGGLAYEARQQQRVREKEKSESGGSGVIGVSPEPPTSTVTVSDVPPPPPAPKKPMPEPEPIVVEMEEEEQLELIDFSRNSYQGLPARLMELKIGAIRKGLGNDDAEKVLRRVNLKFDLNLGSRDIDAMDRGKKNYHIRRALQQFPAHMSLGRILIAPVILPDMMAA
jgi:hypothetical protein